MSKVVLSTAPITMTERYGEFSGAGSMQPSFGVALLGATALAQGADTHILDASADGLALEETLAEIKSINPDVLGISSTTLGIFASGELARRYKEIRPDALTIIGGCHVTALPEETLAEFPGFDIAVIGEGECTFAELLDEIKNGNRCPEKVAGAAIRSGNDIVINDPRPPIKDMDELPFPAWRLLKGFPHQYQPSPARRNRTPFASIVLSRGCPFGCHFCDRSVFGRKTRAYSCAYAVNMIRDMQTNYGIREIMIEDDTFVLSRKRMTEFCERLIAEKMDITWSCLGRADTVTRELLALMKKAGCWHVSYGVESGDQAILDAVNKGESLEQIESALAWTREAGLKSKGFFILGFPNETQETLQKTIDFARRLTMDDISVSQMTPYPGTELYNNADKYGSFNADWRAMNQLTTVFVPFGLTKEDIEIARAKMLRMFYLRPKIIWAKIQQAFFNPAVAMAYVSGFFSLLKVIFKSPAKATAPK